MEDRRQTEPSAYARGVKAGQIDRELANHVVRLDQINGSMERVADRLTSIDSKFGDVHLALQKIKDQMVADIATVEATARALREAADAQRLAAEKRWSPVQKWIAVIVALVVVGGFIITLITVTQR